MSLRNDNGEEINTQELIADRKCEAPEPLILNDGRAVMAIVAGLDIVRRLD